MSVDNKVSRYWTTTIYGGSVIARDGRTDGVVTTVSLGYCPIISTYDFFKNRVWVGAQCGADNDPVFAIDADTFQIVAGPIGSGHVMGNIIANGANGVLYLTATEPTGTFSERVDPTTFAVTSNTFGQVMTINASTNTLYAIKGMTLQIINGAPHPEVILHSILLSYTPGSMSINTALNYLYIANPAGASIEVRNPSTGALITTFYLPAGVTPNGPIAVDSIRGRIYVLDYTNRLLLVIEDLIAARTRPNCRPGH